MSKRKMKQAEIKESLDNRIAGKQFSVHLDEDGNQLPRQPKLLRKPKQKKPKYPRPHAKKRGGIKSS